MRESLAVEFDPVIIAERSESQKTMIAKSNTKADLDKILENDETRTEREISARGAVIKQGQRKKVIWVNSGKFQTEYSIVYVHGFSAGPLEVEPVISSLALGLKANLHFTRLRAHGLSDGEDFATVRAQDWAVDVEEAFAVGQRIGRNVIVIAMSTGAPLVLESIYRHAPESIRALVLLSPNYEPAALGTSLLVGSHGAPIARMLLGSYREFEIENPVHRERWTARYRAEGLGAMAMSVESVRRVSLASIRIPVLTIYTKRDEVVDTDLIVLRSSEFSIPSKAIEWSIANRHELVSAAFHPEHVPELVALIDGWLRKLEIGTTKLKPKTGERR